MIRKTLSSWLGIAVLLGMSGSMASASSPTPDKAVKGVYNCLLEGGFISRPFSKAQMQFKADGAGNVVSSDPGEIAVTLGFFNTPVSPNTHSFTGGAEVRLHGIVGDVLAEYRAVWARCRFSGPLWVTRGALHQSEPDHGPLRHPGDQRVFAYSNEHRFRNRDLLG